MPQTISFTDVRAATDPEHTSVLLGNGFSRACRDDIFAYSALFDRADFRGLSPFVRLSFDALGTTDFELVMDALRRASTLVRVYRGAGDPLARELSEDAERLKEVLVHAIADSHPAFPAEIDGASYEACRGFLSTFGRVYTLNYDLLLYWAFMQRELQPDLRFDDGFRTPEDGPEPYVTWEIENTSSQRVFYLHGVLHLFDAGAELQKYTWANTGERLIDQIRQALDAGKYPMFVAEGDSRSKRRRIKHSDYLSRGLRSFAAIGGDLVIFGHSFAENDDHILKLISRQRTRNLFVGLFGNPNSGVNLEIERKALALAAARKGRNVLRVTFFDSASAHVWG